MELVKDYVSRVHNGNKTRAAALIGVNRDTVARWIEAGCYVKDGKILNKQGVDFVAIDNQVYKVMKVL